MFGVTPAYSGQIFIEGGEIVVRSPGLAMEARLAFLTEDRKETGCFLMLDITSNMQAAILWRGFSRGGVVILGVLTSGFTFLNVDAHYQEIIKGGVIVAAVIADQYRQRKRGKV